MGLLLVGFGYAAWSDLRDREVSDTLWQVLGPLGVAIGAIVVAPAGALPLAMWLVVGALALEHLFPWDDLLGASADRWADLLEGVAYAGVIAIVALGVVRYGVGPASVPWSALALLISILLARGLFELGVLYGGADAKAVIVAGMLVPVFTDVAIALPASAVAILAVLPFAFNLLLNAALLSVAIPLALAVRNLARGDFGFPKGFTGYFLPVPDLPTHFVWVEDPARPGARPDDAETSEEDREERERLARELTARGIDRVWVTPQIPFLVLVALL